MDDSRNGRVTAWDGPTRLFHWLLVLLVVLAPVSHRFGGIELAWHKWNGLAILTLVVFRILWGFVGGDTARFAAFIRGPGAAITHGRALFSRTKPRYLGHNPLGGWMILALLAVLTGQALFGLYTTDDVLAEGFLAGRAGEDTVKWASVWHHRTFTILLVLVAVHVAVNLAYRWLAGENLITPMITGHKPAADYADLAAARPGSWGRAALCLAVAAGLVAGGISLAGGQLI